MEDREWPLVTINILVYNRKAELRITLSKVLSDLDYPEDRLEVIVVDNASADGVAEMVETEFPNVRLIRLLENVGIAGWNAGFLEARGEYIIVMDDDSHLAPNVAKEMVRSFESDPKVGIVAFLIFDTNTGKTNAQFMSREPLTFIGCGAGIRSNILSKTGLFSTIFFLYCHEIDFSIRVMKHNYSILYRDDLIAYHRFAKKNRIKARQRFYSTRNSIWFYLKYFRGRFLIILLLRQFLVLSFVKSPVSYLRALISAFSNIRLPLLEGEEIPTEVQALYYKYMLSIFTKRVFALPHYLLSLIKRR